MQAYDDFEVVSVAVWVGSAAGDTYVEGAATLVDGRWQFTPNSTVDVGEAVVIKATATDRAGRTGALGFAVQLGRDPRLERLVGTLVVVLLTPDIQRRRWCAPVGLRLVLLR